MSNASLRIEEVTDIQIVPELALLADLALQPDSFHAFITKYGTKSVYDETIERLTAAIEDPHSYVFKAILTTTNNDNVSKEQLVGLTQWYVGYVDIPKVDPFAPKASSGKMSVLDVAKLGTVEADGAASDIPAPKAVSSQPPFDPFAENARRTGNAYIGAIRGKKHIYLRRMIVHPDHQRKGIGQKLLQWGVDVADRENIVGWLFARPAASKHYEKNGWKAFESIPIEVSDIHVDPVVAMLRPRPRD